MFGLGLSYGAKLNFSFTLAKLDFSIIDQVETVVYDTYGYKMSTMTMAIVRCDI